MKITLTKAVLFYKENMQNFTKIRVLGVRVTGQTELVKPVYY